MGLRDLFKNSAETMRAADAGAKLDDMVAKPFGFIAKPAESAQTLLEVAQEADNHVLQDGVTDRIKGNSQQTADQVKTMLPEGMAQEAVTQAQQIMVSGLDNVKALVRKMGLDTLIAQTAEGLAGVTSDRKQYADGVAGMENTLDKAPEKLQKMATEIAGQAESDRALT